MYVKEIENKKKVEVEVKRGKKKPSWGKRNIII